MYRMLNKGKAIIASGEEEVTIEAGDRFRLEDGTTLVLASGNYDISEEDAANLLAASAQIVSRNKGKIVEATDVEDEGDEYPGNFGKGTYKKKGKKSRTPGARGSHKKKMKRLTASEDEPVLAGKRKGGGYSAKSGKKGYRKGGFSSYDHGEDHYDPNTDHDHSPAYHSKKGGKKRVVTDSSSHPFHRAMIHMGYSPVRTGKKMSKMARRNSHLTDSAREHGYQHHYTHDEIPGEIVGVKKAAGAHHIAVFHSGPGGSRPRHATEIHDHEGLHNWHDDCVHPVD